MLNRLKKFQNKKILDCIPNPPFIYDPTSFGVSKKYKGEGVKISIISTGVPSHKDIKNIKLFEVFSPQTKNPDDVFGYSTLLSGIISSNSEQLIGLAPRSELFFVKTYNDFGDTSKSSLISSILWSIIKGVDIITICSEMSYEISILRNAISKAYNSNICIFSLAEKKLISKNDDNENKNIDFVSIYPEIFGVNCSIKDESISLLSEGKTSKKNILKTDYYTTFSKDKYIKAPSQIAALGIISSLASLLIEEKKNDKKEYTPRDIYTSINKVII
jgi:hypothetical protein